MTAISPADWYLVPSRNFGRVFPRALRLRRREPAAFMKIAVALVSSASVVADRPMRVGHGWVLRAAVIGLAVRGECELFVITTDRPAPVGDPPKRVAVLTGFRLLGVAGKDGAA